KHGPEKVDSITDTESAIRHFRCTSKVYKEQRDQYKAERDNCLKDIDQLRERNRELERENEKLSRLIDVKDNAFKGADRIIKNQ
ncbi:hypothetical protein Q0M30_17670, partial [Staphylococcus aureus]|nr:hypothetical protein [Staphylococcus aureus]